MKSILVLILLVIFASCTSNQRARQFGGTETVTLKPSERFINATWKDQNIWIVVYDSVEQVYKVREKSSYGLLEGEIIIK